jgi:phosphoribosylformylglycinamidine (FGAM) synthase PurS component
MTEINPDRITGTISMTVLPQANGQYICQMSPTLSDSHREDIQCYGQTKEHAIAIALEQLADDYRRIAEEKQNLDWDTVERTESGEAVAKHYHVILHYERIAEDESKFEAMHNTMMGNTVVENAKITVIEINSDLQLNLAEGSTSHFPPDLQLCSNPETKVAL